MDEWEVKRWSPGEPIPQKGILMIRHGPREPGPFPDRDVPLTQEGEAQCLDLGKNWNGRIPNCLLSSPVPRCVQTAKLILEGAGWNIPIYESQMLGDHGPFVVDLKKFNAAINEAHQTGKCDIFERHVAGESIPGLLHRDVGVRRMLNDIKVFMEPEKLILAVTHDYFIAATIAALGYNSNPWPSSLHGVSMV